MVLHEDAVLKRVDLDELLGGGASDLWLMDPEGLLSTASPDAALAHLDSESFLANISSSASLKNIEYPMPSFNLLNGLKLDSLATTTTAVNGVPNSAMPNNQSEASNSTSKTRPAATPIEPSPAPKRRRNTITAAAVRDALSRTSATDAQIDNRTSSMSPMSSPGDGSSSNPSTPMAPASEQQQGSTTVFAGKQMTKDDLLRLENKLEKNRVMAKEARRKKKEYLKTLEDQMAQYQQTIATLQQRLAESERRNCSLQTELNLVKASITGAHTQSDSSLLNLATAQVASTLLNNLGPALLPYLAQNASTNNSNIATSNHSNSITDVTAAHNSIGASLASARNQHQLQTAAAGMTPHSAATSLQHHVTAGAHQIPHWASAGSSLSSASHHHLPGGLNLQLNVSNLSSAQPSVPLVSTPRGSGPLSTSPV